MSDQWSSLTVKNLTTALREVIDWKLLGVQLKMNIDDLKTIECDYSRLTERKIELYRLWLKGDTNPTWENVFDALKQMGLHDLARRVQSEFCPAGIKGHQLIPEQKSIPEQSSHLVSQSITEQELYREHQSSPKQYDHTTGVATSPQEQRLNPNEQPVQASTTPLPIAANVATPPHLALVAKMSPVDRLREIEDAIKKLESKFRDLVFSAQDVLIGMAEQSPHFLSKLRTCIALLPATRSPRHLRFLKERQEDIFRASSVGEIFYILSPYWNFTNYHLLEHLITSLGDNQLKTKLQAYLDDLKVFEDNTTVKDFIRVRRSYLDLPPDFSEVAVKLRDEWADYSLSRIHQLCQELSEISSLNAFSTIFTGGSFNSIHLCLAVPSLTLHLLAAALDDKFLHNHGIEVIHIEGVELHAYQQQCVQRRELQLEREDHKVTSPPEDLVQACRYGDVIKTLQLVDEGADINASARVDMRGRKVHTPLTLSSREGHSDIVSVLLCSDADVNKPDGDPYDPFTPLMWGCCNGHVPVVHLLLEHHADVNIHSKRDGFTALYLACVNNHPEIVHLLLEARAEVDARNEWGNTALMRASDMLASMWGYLDVVRLLLAQGANVNLQDRHGQTAVFKASMDGHSSVVQELLQGGADPNIPIEYGRTALMMASGGGHLDIIRLLLAQGANVNLQDSDGETAVFKASWMGHSSVVQELLQGGANPNTPTKHGQTAVFKASMWCRSSVVKELLQGGADPNIPTKSGETALMKASDRGHLDVVRLLLAQGDNVNLQDSDGETAVFKASMNGHSSVVQELLQGGADPNTPTKEGLTSLIVAIKLVPYDSVATESRIATVKVLLTGKASVETQEQSTGWTALFFAANKWIVEFVRLLIQHGANPSAVDKEGLTPLIVAIKGPEYYFEEALSTESRIATVKVLLTGKASVETQEQSTGWTALFFAANKGIVDIVRLLIQHGANPSAVDKSGETALMEASGERHLYVVWLLLDQGANVNLQDMNGETAVFKASMKGHSSVVQELLQGGADPNTPTKEGLTPLIVAIKGPEYYFEEAPSTKSRIATVEVLLTGKASVETQEQSTGWTALFFAANEGIVDIVRLLIQHGANPSAVDKQGLTPLDVARDRRHSDICEKLEKYLTTETKETQYQEPDSEIQKPDSEEHLTTESQEAHSPPQQSHSGTTEPDSEEPLTTESQEAHSLTQQSHSETTGPDSETLKSQQPPGVEETTPKGVLPETESNRSKSVRKRMEEARRRILAVFGRLQERLLQSKAEKTRTLAEQQEIPYPSQKQHPRKEEIQLEKV